jgi:hypothetical protein
VPAWDPKTPFSPGTFIACTGRRIPPAKSDDELMRQSLAELKRHDFRAAVASGPLEIVSRWRAASDRVIPAISFFNGTDDHGRPRLRPLDELRQLVKDKKVQVFAEVGPQYRGMAPADPALDPYFALAEELDIPVGLHMGEGPPGGPNFPSYEKYRVAMGDPLLLEPLLTKHPKLRLYVMHYGSPFVDNMIAILYSYPQVYVDIACNDWGFPRKQFHDALRRLVDAGFRSASCSAPTRWCGPARSRSPSRLWTPRRSSTPSRSATSSAVTPRASCDSERRPATKCERLSASH